VCVVVREWFNGNNTGVHLILWRDRYDLPYNVCDVCAAAAHRVGTVSDRSSSGQADGHVMPRGDVRVEDLSDVGSASDPMSD
jgi:hypothetical protein